MENHENATGNYGSIDFANFELLTCMQQRDLHCKLSKIGVKESMESSKIEKVE